ncbi:helix-turn-helix domain-containing protein [Gilvimarinus sp. SDUM040013]|uniref:Helix-turn-helix domain-containing protein n=1 Tax=Gilvimarinus gilvus TaxID=3058038 RepID=A0ABU4RZB2_9GAMM|nr:helix-turn-helix domain-containing protein [Gilvimarinus sp. SDUM040013]MDO3388711.1 helix-turn-helix domain-containing protein [Gilvimarinus sp. SDUM040013]MDX6849606.1 helix-turn-helix domain-containing protein [Gilvimarinus sp. SDUM040013]
MLFSRTGNRLANRLLLVLVALMLLPPINVYSQMAFGTIDWCWVLTTNLSWIYGPLLLGFVQAIRGQGLPRSWPVHLLPFVITLVWRFSGAAIPMQAIAVALTVHLLVYLALSFGLVVRHKKALLEKVSLHKTAYFYWLVYVVAGLAVLMLIDTGLITLYAWFEPLATWPWRFLVMLISLYLQGLAFVCVYRPKLLLNDSQRAVRQVVEHIAPAREPALAASTAKELQANLEDLMAGEKLYLDNDLSLKRLAEILGVSTHQLSSLLNDYLQQSFYDYINRMRLDEALRLLRLEPAMPIVELAYEAGFNNKNTFYRLFKERTGLTPTQFRKAPLDQKILVNG